MASITLAKKNGYKGVSYWYARVPRDDGDHYFSLHTKNKTLAKQRMQENIRNGVYDVKTAADFTVGDLQKSFLEYQEKRLKARSFLNVIYAVKTLDNIQGIKLCDVSRKDIADAFVANTTQYSSHTYRSMRTIVIHLFNYAVDVLEAMTKNEAKFIPQKKLEHKDCDFWTIEQVDAIIDHAPNASTRLLWSFMAFAGLRVSEAAKVKKSDINNDKITILGKGNKLVTLPIAPRLAREIEKFERLGIEWKFARNTIYSLRNAAKFAMPFQGRAHFHRFRYSFGSNLFIAGANIKAVQKLMRHENPELTLKMYCNVMQDNLVEALEKTFK